MVIGHHNLLYHRFDRRSIKEVLLTVIVRRSCNYNEISISIDCIRRVVRSFLSIIPYGVKIKRTVATLCLRKVLLNVLVLNRTLPFVKSFYFLFNDVHSGNAVFLA